MKVKEFCGKHKKKIIIISVSLITVVVIAVGVTVYFVRKGNTIGNPFGQGRNAGVGFELSGEMVGATGVTNVGVTEETFPVENLTTGLEVEEVYVSSDDAVEAGTSIVKFTAESISDARAELEQTLKEADLAYRAGIIEYEQSKITAKYDYENTLLEGEQAEQIYKETIANLQSEITRAKESLEETREQIAEYESYVNDGSYRSYFKVDEYQVVYDETLEILVDKMDEWGIDWSQVTGGGMSGRITGMGGSDNQYVTALSSLYSILEDHLDNLEQAQSDYDDAVANAAFELQTLQLQLPGLEQAVIEAQEKYDTQVLQAKLTYETSVSNAEHAVSDYETALQKAESDYEVLKNAWEDAQENLELFESCVGDGYFYATNNGTILRTMVRVGREVSSESVIFMYSNPEEMTVTVSVDQADIATITIGDKVYVQSTEYGGFTGEVTELNPVSVSGSRTSVTYQVTVKLTGNMEQMPANTSVTVIFGMTEEEIERMQSATESTTQERMERPQRGEGEMPEGMERPQRGNNQKAVREE